MREIKFRGWHPDAKDMVYFGLGEDHINCMGLHDGENYTFRLEVEHPVMQFTGLTDCNGVEVYEGDVVSDHVGVGEVKYSAKHAAFRVCYDDGMAKWFIDYILVGERESIEVIGNIYQNPEMIQ